MFETPQIYYLDIKSSILVSRQNGEFLGSNLCFWKIFSVVINVSRSDVYI